MGVRPIGLGVFCLLVPLALESRAWADDDGVPEDLPRLVSDTGRVLVKKPEPDAIKIQLHGEYQLRGQLQRSFLMDTTLSFRQQNPGPNGQLPRRASLGQRAFATNWLRITPRLQIRKTIEIVAQMDFAQGFVFGETTHDVGPDEQPRDNSGDVGTYLLPRWLYLDWRTKYGLWRVGMQPNHWGMGIVANDGDHPSIWGDYRLGQISERILFGTKPLGEHGPLTVAIGADVVYRDWTARLYRGDVAIQGVLAAYLEKGPNQIGLFGVVRNQNTDKTAGADIYRYVDGLTVGVIDLAGRFASPVAGTKDAFVYGSGEAAILFGETNRLRTPDQAATGQKTKILSYGGAAILGVAHRARGATRKGDDRPDTWGDLVGQVEIGYASGDANPLDDTEKRFTFDPNHKVGLLLFDEVLRWHTARAAAAAADPLLTNAARPAPGLDLLASNGGVFGAEYIHPTFIYRPRPVLDLKVGAVIAQTTADFVSPYRLVLDGAYVNYSGGDPRKRDLGVELDWGTELRVPVQSGTLQLGAQGGVLFPGGALADAQGHVPDAPWMATLRAGIQY